MSKEERIKSFNIKFAPVFKIYDDCLNIHHVILDGSESYVLENYIVALTEAKEIMEIHNER